MQSALPQTAPIEAIVLRSLPNSTSVLHTNPIPNYKQPHSVQVTTTTRTTTTTKTVTNGYEAPSTETIDNEQTIQSGSISNASPSTQYRHANPVYWAFSKFMQRLQRRMESTFGRDETRAAWMGCHICEKCREDNDDDADDFRHKYKDCFQPFAEIESEQHGSMPTANKALPQLTQPTHDVMAPNTQQLTADESLMNDENNNNNEKALIQIDPHEEGEKRITSYAQPPSHEEIEAYVNQLMDSDGFKIVDASKWLVPIPTKFAAVDKELPIDWKLELTQPFKAQLAWNPWGKQLMNKLMKWHLKGDDEMVWMVVEWQE
jgi:hypothetical protein